MKKINEQELTDIIKEAVKKCLNEGISLSDYDNPTIRRSHLDGDDLDNEPYYDEDGPDFDPSEGRYEHILQLYHRGLLNDDEFNAIRDKMGW